jgi:hypothetical protein
MVHTTQKYMIIPLLLVTSMHAADSEDLLRMTQKWHKQLVDEATKLSNWCTVHNTNDVTPTQLNPIEQKLALIHAELKLRFTQMPLNPNDVDALLQICAFANTHIMTLISPYFDLKILKNSQGNTSLMMSAWAGNYEATQFLLAKGADPFALNNKFQSVVHLTTSLSNETNETHTPGTYGKKTVLALGLIIYAKIRYGNLRNDPFETCRKLILQKQQEMILQYIN